jgi:hypothetical protein
MCTKLYRNLKYVHTFSEDNNYKVIVEFSWKFLTATCKH